MALYTIRSVGFSEGFDAAESFRVQLLLRAGVEFSVEVVRWASHVLSDLEALLRERAAHSSWTRRASLMCDYVLNTLGGAVVGGVGMGLTGAATWAGLRSLGLLVAPATPFIGAASLAGLVVGAVGRALATHWGVRVRVSAERPATHLEITLVPLS